MNPLLSLPLARVAVAATVALSGTAALADEANFTRSGGFGSDQEVHSFHLDVGSASDLRLWTSSWAAGQADPVLALFDRHSGALLSLSDDVDAPDAQVDSTQGALDAGISLTDLAAGQYLVAVGVSPNLPIGATWAEGWLLGTSGGNALDSAWTVQVALRHAAPIPEPTTTALLLAGLAAVGWLRSRRC